MTKFTRVQRVNRLGMILALSTAIIAGCEKETLTGLRQPASDRSQSLSSSTVTKFDTVSLDDELLAIDKLSPGFGGMYLDSAGALVIVHTRADALNETIDAIRQVMGDVPQLHAPRIVLRKGRFSFSTLAS